jgi:hypothetical protein
MMLQMAAMTVTHAAGQHAALTTTRSKHSIAASRPSTGFTSVIHLSVTSLECLSLKGTVMEP